MRPTARLYAKKAASRSAAVKMTQGGLYFLAESANLLLQKREEGLKIDSESERLKTCGGGLRSPSYRAMENHIQRKGMNKMNQTQTRSPRKRLLSLILAVILMIGLLPISAFATGDGYELSAGSRFFIVNESDPTGTDLGNYVQLIGQEFAAKGKPSSSVLPIVYGQEKDAEKGDIVVKLDSSLGEQSYKVSVGQKIVVTGGDAAGAFYGLTNLLQMFEKNSLQDVTNTPLVAERSAYIDCGRVYYSPALLKALIKTLAWNRMNTLYLDFSNNNATRFFLDKMEVTAGDAKYDITTAKPSDGKYLTQADMVDIIKVAKQYGVQIIPTFNSPGHIGGLCSLNESLFVKGTATDYDSSCGKITLNIANQNAYDFGQAVVKLYVDFFAQQGCKSFNIAADEATLSGVKYDSTNETFVKYVNDLNTYIEGKGMTTRMFNDGVKSVNSGIDEDIVILYWTTEGDSSAVNLIGAGYKVVNFNCHAGLYYAYMGSVDGAYVWNQNVEKLYDNWNPGVLSCKVYSWNSREYEYTPVETMKYSEYAGKLIGANFAVWSDYAFVNNKDGTAIINADDKNVVEKIQVVGDRCWSNKSSETYANWKAGLTTAPGGINVSTYAIDGTVLPAASGITAASQVEIPVEDANNTGVSVVVKGEKGQTGSLTVDKLETSLHADAITAAGAEKSVSYNVTPAVDGKAYTGEGTVTLPVPAEWEQDAARIRAYIIDNGAVKLISGTLSGGKYTFQVPHFSEMGLVQLAKGAGLTPGYVTVSEGGDKVITISGVNLAKDGTPFTTEDPSIATVTVTGQDETPSTVTYDPVRVSYSTLAGSNTSWTKTQYFYKVDGNYYPVYAYCNVNWSIFGYYNYYVGYSKDGGATKITVVDGERSDDTITVYKQSGTDAVPASTTITFHGVKAGAKTYANIGGVRYEITVTEKTIVSGNTIELPVSIVDYRADGLLFDYDVNDKNTYSSYAYSLVRTKMGDSYSVSSNAIAGTTLEFPSFGGHRKNSTDQNNSGNYNAYEQWGGAIRTGLVQDTLGANGMPVYTDAAVKFVAERLAHGAIADQRPNKDENRNDILYNTFLKSGADRSVLNSETSKFSTEFSTTKTYANIKNAYDLAWYLLNTIYEGDKNTASVTDKVKGGTYTLPIYGMATDVFNKMILRQSDDDTYYYLDCYVDDGQVVLDKENKAIYNGDSGYKDGTKFFYPLTGEGYDKYLGDTTDMQPQTTVDTENDWYPVGANGNFTLKGEAQFIYRNADDLYFTFSGDDDVYLFINNKLALDIGGSHWPVEKTVNLNELSAEYGLEEGQVATFTFFYMERCADASNFSIKTNIELAQRDINVEKKAYDTSYVNEYASGTAVINGTTVAYDLIVTNKSNSPMTQIKLTDTDSLGGNVTIGSGVDVSPVVTPGKPNDKGTVALGQGNGYVLFITDSNGAEVKGSSKSPSSLQALSDEIAGLTLPAGQSLHVRFLTAKTEIKPSKILDYINTVEVSAKVGGQALSDTASHELYSYNANDTGRTYVVDFGLPLEITGIFDSDAQNNIGEVSLSPKNVQRYGTVTIAPNGFSTTLTYTRTADKTINEPETITLDVAYKFGTNNIKLEKTLTIIPASNVYYEDSLAAFTDGKGAAQNAVWSIVGNDGNAATEKTGVYQALQELGKGDRTPYGNDVAYNETNSSMLSMGTAHKVTVTADMLAKWNDTTSAWPTAQFTFKGTGFDVISLTNNKSGAIFVDVYAGSKAEGKAEKKYVVNNYYGYTYNKDTKTWEVTPNVDNTLYQIPVMKITDLAYGEHTVVIKVAYSEYFDTANKSEYSFWLDAIRVYNPMGKDYDYTADNEGYPQYIKLRDELAKTAETNKGVVFIDGAANASIADYANFGPNNEVYLANGQAISFKLAGDTSEIASIQIGAKAPDGKPANIVVTGNVTGTNPFNKELKTATEMYYDITEQAKDGQLVTITNKSGGILSLTNLKITYRISGKTVTLSDLTAAEQANAVAMVQALFAAPVEAFQPETFQADWGRAVRAGKRATLTVKTSADVESITVDGQPITSYTTRTERTGWGWWSPKVTYHVFTYTTTAPAQTTDYAVCAVNAEGTASEPITATLTVKPATWWNWWF